MPQVTDKLDHIILLQAIPLISLNNDGHKFLQYQQNEQSTQMTIKTDCMWRGKSNYHKNKENDDT